MFTSSRFFYKHRRLLAATYVSVLFLELFCAFTNFVDDIADGIPVYIGTFLSSIGAFLSGSNTEAHGNHTSQRFRSDASLFERLTKVRSRSVHDCTDRCDSFVGYICYVRQSFYALKGYRDRKNTDSLRLTCSFSMLFAFPFEDLPSSFDVAACNHCLISSIFDEDGQKGSEDAKV